MCEFSVLIPTRNRQTSSLLSIKSALATQDVDVEVVVADNSDVAIAHTFDDPRLRVLPPENRVLSMPDNWERAIRAARGQWLIVLSDKCRLVPGALRTLRALAGDHYKAITYCRTYFFQDLSTAESQSADILWESPGSLRRPPLPFLTSVQDSKQVMREWFDRTDYVDGFRPMLYCALLHRSIVQSLLSKYPSFLVGMAPDVASGLCALSQTHNYLDTNIPATITQFPTTNLANWSNGFANASGKASRLRFYSEFATDQFRRYHLPTTGTSVVMQTLLEFARLRKEEIPPATRVGWAYFAQTVAHEIERYPVEERNKLQLQLLRALIIHDPPATWIQAKSAVVARLPALYGYYKKLLNRSTQPSVQTSTRDLWANQNGIHCPSVAAALSMLERDVTEPSSR